MSQYKSVIEELFNGNVMISEMLQPQGEEADLHRQVQAEMAQKLQDSLSKEQYKLHEKYMETAYDTQGDEVYKAYLQGIYLGLRLMAESFYNSEL